MFLEERKVRFLVRQCVAGSKLSAKMQLFRRIIALVGRFETPSSDWGRPCPRIFLRRSLFVGSLNDSAAPGRKSRDNSKRTRIPYSSASFVRVASPKSSPGLCTIGSGRDISVDFSENGQG